MMITGENPIFFQPEQNNRFPLPFTTDSHAKIGNETAINLP
jgi:hypothetical protein